MVRHRARIVGDEGHRTGGLDRARFDKRMRGHWLVRKSQVSQLETRESVQ